MRKFSFACSIISPLANIAEGNIKSLRDFQSRRAAGLYIMVREATEKTRKPWQGSSYFVSLHPMQFSSILLENAVAEFSKLPGIGKKTALRLVLHLLKQDNIDVTRFSEVVARMRSEIRFCQRCHNVADADICSICSNSMRKQEMICVVENIRDVIAIESTQQYNGTYHVLGGVISPLDGIGPDQLTIDGLLNRIDKEQTEELIFALNPTIQGDTTIYYVQKKLKPGGLRITTIARGIAFGGELEYADEMTLARSLQNRLPVESYVANK